jgi:hypothetical protein
MNDPIALDPNTHQRQSVRGFLRGLAPDVGNLFLVTGGAMFGQGLDQLLSNPPTATEFLDMLNNVCSRVNSGDSTILSCELSRLAAVAAIFPSEGVVSMITGSTLIGGVALVALAFKLYEWRRGENAASQNVGNSVFSRLSTFGYNAAWAIKNVTLAVGGAVGGIGLQSYLAVPNLPLFQQILEVIRISANPLTNDTAIIVNTTRLNSISGMFAQASPTACAIGSGLLGTVLVGGIANAFYQCLWNTENPEEEVLLSDSENDLPTR